MTYIVATKRPPTAKDPREERYSPAVLLVFQNGSYFSYVTGRFDHTRKMWEDINEGGNLTNDVEQNSFVGWMELPCQVKSNIWIVGEKPLSQAKIGYGISLGVGFDIHPDFYDWHRLYAEKIGRPDWNDLHRIELLEIWKETGVTLVYGGDGTSVMTCETVVVATPSFYRTEEEKSLSINSLQIDPSWNDHLQKFFTVMGFEFKQPTWVLVASQD